MARRLYLTLRLAFLALVAFPAAGAAQWLHEESGGAFSDSVHTAGTAAGGYVFGLRCTSPDDVALIYITPETISDDQAFSLTLMSPQILLRIDGGDVVELNTVVESNGGRGAFYTPAGGAIVEDIGAATATIAVAARIGENIIHEQEFGVVGSGRATNALRDGCAGQ